MDRSELSPLKTPAFSPVASGSDSVSNVVITELKAVTRVLNLVSTWLESVVMETVPAELVLSSKLIVIPVIASDIVFVERLILIPSTVNEASLAVTDLGLNVMPRPVKNCELLPVPVIDRFVPAEAFAAVVATLNVSSLTLIT